MLKHRNNGYGKNGKKKKKELGSIRNKRRRGYADFRIGEKQKLKKRGRWNRAEKNFTKRTMVWKKDTE